MAGDIWASIATGVASGGAVAAAFWGIFNKALDQRLSQMLEKHKADLAAQVHTQNTVFSRLDQQRADAVQKIAAEILAYRWKLLEFTPKLPFGDDSRPTPEIEAIVWCSDMQTAAKTSFQVVNTHGLLLPRELFVKLLTWYMLANQLATHHCELFMSLAQHDEFRSSGTETKRQMLLQAKEKDAEHKAEMFSKFTNQVLDDLRLILNVVGKIPDGAISLSTPLGEITRDES